MTFSEILGSFGVSILLVAYFLNLLKVVKTDDLTYPLLNFCGAAIACYASWLIPYFPFVILEGVWAMLSAISVIKWLKIHNK